MERHGKRVRRVLTPNDILINPGLLKLDLMTHGLAMGPEAATAIADLGYRVTGHGPFGGADDLDVVLGQDTWVCVPLVDASQTPYLLIQTPQGFSIGAQGTDAAAAVRLAPRSGVFDHVTSTGAKFGSFGTVHGSYLALSPTSRCTFLGSSAQCTFCGVHALSNIDSQLPVEDVVEAIRIAKRKHAVSMVYLSVGHLGTSDGGVRFLEPYVQAIKKHFDILVAIDALPPEDNHWIDRTYAMGVDAVSYNLEIFDPEIFTRVCPGPAQTVGRARFMEALEYATSVFPSGGVTSHLIVGLEPLASTRQGITELTQMGVLPVLPVYRPFKGRDMRTVLALDAERPSLVQLADLYAHLHEQVQHAGLSLNLVRDISIATTPLDARFFAQQPSGFRQLLHRMLRTQVARRTSAYLSDLRRNLRVRELS